VPALGGPCFQGPVPPVPYWSSVVLVTAPHAGVFPWHAMNTRRPWASSHASGGATPVDRCTNRRLDTNDCRQLHHIGEDPPRRTHRGNKHIPEGWVEALVRGCDRGVFGWDGSLACPSDEGSSVSVEPVAGGLGCVSPCRPTSTASGSVSIGASGGSVGHPVYPPACSRLPVPGRLQLVSEGGPEGQDTPGEVPTALGRPSLIAPPPAGCRESGEPRQGGGLARKGGFWRPTVLSERHRVALRGGSVARPACVPPSQADFRGAVCP